MMYLEYNKMQYRRHDDIVNMYIYIYKMKANSVIIYLQHVQQFYHYFQHINLTMIALFIYKLVMMWETAPL